MNIDFKEKIETTDYEKSLRNTIQILLKPKNLKDCFFHFFKPLWKKDVDCGLTEKYCKDGTIILFCFKMYPFIHNENKKYYFDKI